MVIISYGQNLGFKKLRVAMDCHRAKITLLLIRPLPGRSWAQISSCAQVQMSQRLAVENFAAFLLHAQRSAHPNALLAISAGDAASHVSTSTMNHTSAFAVWRRAMHKTAYLAIVLLVCIVSTGAQMKDVYIPGVPPPPPPLDPDHGKTGPDEPKLQRRIDPVKLQRDADD